MTAVELAMEILLRQVRLTREEADGSATAVVRDLYHEVANIIDVAAQRLKDDE